MIDRLTDLINPERQNPTAPYVFTTKVVVRILKVTKRTWILSGDEWSLRKIKMLIIAKQTQFIQFLE